MRCIDVLEGADFNLPRAEAERLREAVERLRVQLRPSFPLLSERAGAFRLSNVIGTIDLGAGLVVQVSPKVATDDDWTTAAVSLLTGKEGVDVAGERRAGTSQTHNKLLDGVAGVYLKRLERAFRQEGPIVLMERVVAELPYLHGKLDATRWARSALWRPHIFPVARTQLAQDNPFTRGLLLVADTLAHVCSNQKTRNGLRAISRDLAAGMPQGGSVSAGLSSRSLPEQWSAYKPAWSLAAAILSKTSLFGPTGQHTGVGLAIEAWPLLETLLERTLQSVERVGLVAGRSFAYQMQGEVRLLEPVGALPQRRFAPEPDGRLFENGALVASFEAKYSSFDGAAPARDHTYQALSTAAACGAPLAVLVYPNAFEPKVWEVTGFHNTPAHLVAIGLDLFKWLPAGEANARGEMVLNALDAWKYSVSHGAAQVQAA